MEIALGILGLAAIAFGALWIRQIFSTREHAARSLNELESLKKLLSQKESDAQKSAEARRQATEELKSAKDEVKELKKKRHEERDTAKLKRDLEQAKEDIEREFATRLSKAQEDAAQARSDVRRLNGELQATREKLSVLQKDAAERAVAAQAHVDKGEAQPVSELSSEDKIRLEKLSKVETALDLTKKSFSQAQDELQIAKRDLDRMRRERDQLDDQLKKTKGRADLDRRLFLVQKGELELAKDKFRTLESRYNALLLEKDELAKSRWMLEKELKTLKPLGADAAKLRDEASEPKAASKEVSTADVQPVEVLESAAAPALNEAAPRDEAAPANAGTAEVTSSEV